MLTSLFVEYVPNCVSAFTDASGVVRLDMADGSTRTPTQEESLIVSKAEKVREINTDCRSRLLARFGDPAEQVSRSLGIYGATEKSAMETGIAATIDASNTASNAALTATTVAAVEAVAVTWPVI